MNGPRLHCYGCGRAARVILRWLHEQAAVDIGQVCNRSLASARVAVDFIGAGQAVTNLDADVTGDWLLLGIPDGELSAAALGLACRMPGQAELVFHLSGSTPAAVLEPLGVPVASVHPARAFAEPEAALGAMPGTWCVGEGQAEPLRRLQTIFEKGGGRWLSMDASGKAAYHAATVVASNYLVTLNELARSLASVSGLPAPEAADLLDGLQRAGLDALKGSSPASVLTGPIERGDAMAVARLVAAADEQGQGELFRALGLATLRLAQSGRGSLASDSAVEASLTSRSD
ncbi:MAG: DUF2520 domain-containing protein [Wenzhouxiangella sp.]|nr:MAG: DUF2520 domain-containing protein [Wenzhouxiangella sp.]